MDVFIVMRILWRWWWVVLLPVLVTLVVLGLRLRGAEDTYEARVKLLVTPPQQQDVTLFANPRSANLRDEMTVAVNNYIEVVRSGELHQRTVELLGLEGKDAAYKVSVRPVRDSDVLYVSVRAHTPMLAEQIANVHVQAAIDHYGEVRAKPAAAAKEFIKRQLETAAREVGAAEVALATFSAKNSVGPLDKEISLSQELLEQLQLERSQRLSAGLSAASVEGIISARSADLLRLLALMPEYSQLQTNVERARQNSQFLLDKHAEAALKEDLTRGVSFIQVAEPAKAPAQPAPTRALAYLVLGLAGSLGLGVFLALLLQSGVPAVPERQSALPHATVGAPTKADADTGSLPPTEAPREGSASARSQATMEGGYFLGTPLDWAGDGDGRQQVRQAMRAGRSAQVNK